MGYHYQIKRVPLAVEAIGRLFSMQIPQHSTIEEVGISPADEEASLWYTVLNGEIKEATRNFVVVLDDAVVKHDGTVTHCGQWWAGKHTFHLYELFPPYKAP